MITPHATHPGNITLDLKLLSRVILIKFTFWTVLFPGLKMK